MKQSQLMTCVTFHGVVPFSWFSESRIYYSDILQVIRAAHILYQRKKWFLRGVSRGDWLHNSASACRTWATNPLDKKVEILVEQMMNDTVCVSLTGYRLVGSCHPSHKHCCTHTPHCNWNKDLQSPFLPVRVPDNGNIRRDWHIFQTDDSMEYRYHKSIKNKLWLPVVSLQMKSSTDSSNCSTSTRSGQSLHKGWYRVVRQ